SVLIGGSATAFLSRAAAPGLSPVDRLLTDTLGKRVAPAPARPGDTAPSQPQGSGPKAGGPEPAPAPAQPGPAGSPAPGASASAAATTTGLRPLADTGTDPFAGLVAGAYAGYASGTVLHADALQGAN